MNDFSTNQMGTHQSPDKSLQPLNKPAERAAVKSNETPQFGGQKGTAEHLAHTPVHKAADGAVENVRQFVNQGVGAARDHADKLRDQSAKATDALESRMGKHFSSLLNMHRQVQKAVFEDSLAFLEAFQKVASSRSLQDAARAQMEFIRERNEAALARIKEIYQVATETAKESTHMLDKAAEKTGEIARNPGQKPHEGAPTPSGHPM